MITKKDSGSIGKTPKMWIIVLPASLLLVLAVIYISVARSDALHVDDIKLADDNTTFDWKEIVVADMLPDPESAYGHKVTQEQCTHYREACKENGFMIDAEETEDSFHAFHGKDYEVMLSYFDDAKVMYLFVTEGKNLGTTA